MKAVSYWIETLPLSRAYPPLAGKIETEVVVIGGGIAGLSAAYFLSKAGKKVTLVEQNTLASGASGYTTAFISHFLDNTESTLKAWEAGEEVLKLFQEVVGSEKFDCEFKRVASLAFTLSKERAKNLEADALKLKKLKPSISFLPKKEASEKCRFEVEGAMYIETEAQFHVRKFLTGLAKVLEKSGVKIFEDSYVLDVMEDGKKIVLEHGEIKAEKTIIVTNLPSQKFSEVVKLLKVYLTYVIAADFADPRPFGDYLLWDDEEPYHYFRWVNPEKVILGGEDRLMAGAFKDKSDPYEKLKTYLEELTKRKATLTHAWQGDILMTEDSLPYYGSHPAYGENILFATGFGGNGMTFGFLAGKVLADMIVGKENKFAKLFSFKR